MSSTVPSRDNDYKFPPAPTPAVLTREVWDGVMADLSARLASVEAQRTELVDLINDLSFNGQARIDEAITPLIEQTQAQLAMLQADAEALRDQIDLILAGGIPAAGVAESLQRVFVSAEEKAALVDALLKISELQLAVIAVSEVTSSHGAQLLSLDAADLTARQIALAIAYSGV